MAIVTRQGIKDWFLSGLKPVQQNYHDWLDSFVHKGDDIPTSQVIGLDAILPDLATQEQVNNLAENIVPIEYGVNGGFPISVQLGSGRLFEVLVVECSAFQCDITIENDGGQQFVFNQDTVIGVYRLDYYMANDPVAVITCSESATIKIFKK